MTQHKDLPVDIRTLSDSVTAHLRNEILRGQRPPGARLSQEELADTYGVSRIPVREALRQLASEGLVTLRARRGAIVSELTTESAQELLAMAGALESIATRRGASRLTDFHLQEMRRLLERMPSQVNRPFDWYQSNQEFHMILVRASGWSRVVKLVEQCRRNLVRHVLRPELFASKVAEWHRQHEGIYEACVSGNTAEVRRLFDEHWSYSSEALMEFAVKEDPDGTVPDPDHGFMEMLEVNDGP